MRTKRIVPIFVLGLLSVSSVKASGAAESPTAAMNFHQTSTAGTP